MKLMTVCFLFNEDLTKVLLMHKQKGVTEGKLNGIGGKLAVDDMSMEACALREIREEVGVSIAVNDLYLLLSCTYFSGVELWVYYAVVPELGVRQVESEAVEWVAVQDVLSRKISDSRFASHGDILYFIYAAYCVLLQDKWLNDSV